MNTLRGSFGTRIDGGEGKVWNLLFPKGEWHGANLKPIGGSIVIDDAMLSEMVANWRDAGRPPLPIRKTHLHLEVEPSAELPELEAAYGLLEDFRVTAQGLEALTSWSDEGRDEVRSGRWNFWSPEWQPKHVDRRTGEVKGWWLSGTALTNSPFFNSMPRVAASVVAAPTHQPHTKGNTMNPELKKRLKMALKCAEECSDEELVASCEKMSASLSASDVTTEKLTAAVKLAVDPLELKLKASEEETAKLKASLVSRDVEALLSDAKLAGKPVESMREFVTAAAQRDGLDAAKKLVAALPVVISTKEQGISGKEDGGEKLQAAQSEYFEKLEAFTKANGLTTAAATRLFNRDNAELAKRAFTHSNS
jgi:phage I-like protein